MKKIIVMNRKGGCGKSTLSISLADSLPCARLVDLDNQKTITSSSQITGRHVPVDLSFGEAEYLILDTPPYEDVNIKAMLEYAYLVIVPCLMGYPDIIGAKSLFALLERKKLLSRTWAVFNKVRRPTHKGHKELEKYWAYNYPSVRFAKNRLSLLRGYQDVFAKPLSGKAKEEMHLLCQEIELFCN